ncbi:MAG TPA: DUF4124 domain-containing protein [Thiothrix sp.]|nr:DUF4124 domain-containing protein [Thiothrix sp.]
MRNVILLLSITLLSSIFSISNAKIYSWKDASGKTVYGDNPPEHNKAKEIKTKELTIVPGYKDPSFSPKEIEVKKEETKQEEVIGYEAFTVAYPKDDEAIRANDGNVTVAFQLSPALKSSDSIFIYVDGKKLVENSKALSASLSSLDRGTHSMFAVVRNNNGDVLLNSDTVSFHILRNSIIK